MTSRLYKTACLILIASLFAFPAIANDLPVKKSKSGICHPPGGTYYARTKNYTPLFDNGSLYKKWGTLPEAVSRFANSEPPFIKHENLN
ncbi:hypothetical protein [Teredinibacter sp. KSP-S5-2]|uniref:hypothetical protein n=1 Tax=Teredinibacter sp. KSP-S5-2 TaxID=3034506 RepID=UPI0029352933|nr:hypothetical protein [Teredinibacter sp. KSP-S5-2]WNO09023.1 hypothetical protein P5V12_18940 [Teredinibacter sp. KSP-S5-2]